MSEKFYKIKLSSKRTEDKTHLLKSPFDRIKRQKEIQEIHLKAFEINFK